MIIAFSILWKLFETHPLNKREEANQLLNNIIQFSAIFSAILITFIVSKVIQIRQERLERLKEITELSNKLTDFRRIALTLKNSHEFWNSVMKMKLDNKYKKLDYFVIKLQYYEYEENIEELKQAYFQETQICGAGLYLGIKSLLEGSRNHWQSELYDSYDHNYIYPLEILEKWTVTNCANVLWTHLDYKWAEYADCFKFAAISHNDKEAILQLCKKINPKKYGEKQFDRVLLGEIGSEFDGYIIPRLYKLTYYNTLGLPNYLDFSLTILLLTIISGVLLPLLLTSFKLEDILVLKLASISSIILILNLLYFLIRFRKILNEEIQIDSK